MILLDVTILWHPKDAEHDREYEDAFAIGRQGIVAVADGVSEAIYSRQWAEILTSAITEVPVHPDDLEVLSPWLSRARDRWQQQISNLQLSWMQRQKLQAVRGAYSTLLWVEFPIVNADIGSLEWRLPFVCRAIGDCCLFQVREGQLLRSFPLTQPEEFECDPLTICSTPWRPDSELLFTAMEGHLQPGDVLVLSSDAFAKWVVQAVARGEEVQWEWFEGLGAEQWSEWVADVRDRSADERMRVDDTTIVFIRPRLEQGECQKCDDASSVTDVSPVIAVRERIVPAFASDGQATEPEADETQEDTLLQEAVGVDFRLTEPDRSDSRDAPDDGGSRHESSQQSAQAADEPRSTNASNRQAASEDVQQPAANHVRSDASPESEGESWFTRFWRSFRRQD